MTTADHSNGSGGDAGDIHVDTGDRSTKEFFKKTLLRDAEKVEQKDLDALETSLPKKLAGFNLGNLDGGMKWVTTMLERVSMLYQMVRDREYKVPPKTLALIGAALIYFVIPTDITPDFIPGIGFIDDAMVLGILWKLVEKEVDAYVMHRQGLVPE